MRTENPRVGGSIPPLAPFDFKGPPQALLFSTLARLVCHFLALGWFQAAGSRTHSLHASMTMSL